MKKRGGGGDEGGSWMDTYGDLVTLLLTFRTEGRAKNRQNR